MQEPRPLQHLRDFAARYPHAWEMAAQFRQDKGRNLPNWPAWCYLPIAASYAIVSAKYGGTLPPQVGADVGICAALTAWRATKGVYKFDPELLAHLLDTPVTGHLPDQLLERLPEWCVYLDLQGAAAYAADHRPLLGCYAHLESDANNGRRELRLVLDSPAGLLPVPLHLTGGNLSESIEQAWAEANRQGAGITDEAMMTLPQKVSKALAPLLSLLLYLCSEQPDIRDEKRTGRRPQQLIPIKTKKGWREFPASAASDWEVGWRVGAALRKAAEQAQPSALPGSEHASPRAHIRKAHWHTYLTGPGRTKRELRWLSPMLVNAGDEELPAVIHSTT